MSKFLNVFGQNFYANYISAKNRNLASLKNPGFYSQSNGCDHSIQALVAFLSNTVFISQYRK